MEFEKRKAATLASMTSPESDKSPKGTIDTPIIPLLNTINSHPCFFTTSSCSGRISVLSQPPIAAATNKKAKGGTWVFITHSKADPESLLNLLSSAKNPDPTHPPSNLVFRFEPLIIAVECKHVLSAQTLVSLAVSSGFRESGITSVNKRVIIAIRCSIRLEVPLGDTENVLVNSEYLRYLVGIANEKMEVNWRRTDGFLNLLLRNGFGGTEVGENGEQEPLLVKEDDKDGSIKIHDMNLLNNAHDRDMDSDARVPNDTHFGSSGVLDICLPMVPMVIVGEPVERLFLWGHSACTLDDINHKKVLIFGGFGGMGRHARRNESLLLDPLCGKLETISVQRAPAPRMGHTSSMVGDLMFLIGGRADPVNILNDIWVLNTETSEWKLLECTGTVFPPRHRHAAAVIDSKIYVFGGLNGEIISSALHILDTSSSEWNEIQVQGEWPCPRHSHWVLQLEKKYAKLGKDMLKKFGWLDLGRKVYSKENGIHICFPVTQKFCTTYRDKQNHPGGALEVLDDINPFKAFSGEGVLSKDFTCLTSLNLLMASGATILADEVVKVKKISSSPLKVTSEAVANLLKHKGLPTELLDQLPTRWERLGDIIVLPMTSFKDPAWDSVGAELWPIVAKSLGAQRLARQEQQQGGVSDEAEPFMGSGRFDGRNLQLHFRSRLSLPLFTGGKVEGEQGAAIHIVLLDVNTGYVVTSGPESTIKLDVAVLEGDFNNEDDEGWTEEEFESHVVKEREGKRPLLTGDLQVTLKEGVGTLGELTFTDNSSWIRSRKFRLGLKVASGFCEGIRVREAKTEAFTVKDHRGELYKKHYPPALNDDVWRLEKIGKDGSFHKRLNKSGIFTVEDFLRLVVRDSQKLRTILGSGMSNKMWDALIEHAKTCAMSGKLYVYYADDTRNVGVVFNNIYELSGLITGEQYLSSDSLSDSQKLYVDTLVKKAYDNWNYVVEYDGKSLLSFKQSKRPGASRNELPMGPGDYPTSFENQLPQQRLAGSVPPEQSSMDSSLLIGASGYNDNPAARYPTELQFVNSNSRAQFDSNLFASHDAQSSNSHQIQTNRYDNRVGLALGPPQSSTSFQTIGTSVQQSNLNPFDDWSHNRDKGVVDEFLSEEEIRLRSHEMLENEDMQHLLRLFSMGGHASVNGPEDGYSFPTYMPSPSPNFSFDEDRGRSGKAVVGWLKIKAAMRWGFFIRKKAAERRARIEELDDE